MTTPRLVEIRKLWWGLVGEAGHYLNRPGELRGGVLELIRAHRDRLEQCGPLVDGLRTMLRMPPPEVRETIVDLRLARQPGFPLPG